MRKNLCFRNDGSVSSGILTMNLKVSGNTIIYLLTKRYTLQETIKCGSVIGVDDFAFKKRHTYRTLIVDEVIHTPVAILGGRDGSAFMSIIGNYR